MISKIPGISSSLFPKSHQKPLYCCASLITSFLLVDYCRFARKHVANNFQERIMTAGLIDVQKSKPKQPEKPSRKPSGLILAQAS